MVRPPAEAAMAERFDKTYGLARSEVMMKIERAVRECDYGGTSWTTRDGWFDAVNHSDVLCCLI